MRRGAGKGCRAVPMGCWCGAGELRMALSNLRSSSKCMGMNFGGISLVALELIIAGVILKIQVDAALLLLRLGSCKSPVRP